jgi:hypothetical protein
MESSFERIEMILKRFTDEDIKNINELLAEFKKIAREEANREGVKRYNAKKQIAEFRERMEKEGYTGDHLESMCLNQMRRLGMITIEELKFKLKELDEHAKTNSK